MPFIENWLDKPAVRMTGMDDGWQSFHEYLTTEGGMTPGVDYWCKVVYEDEKPVAIIAFSLYEGLYTVMEFLIKPELRGHGIGTSLLRELISNGDLIFGSVIEKAAAVIFPTNVASQKAFENAGFVFDHASEDGNAWYYSFDLLDKSIKIMTAYIAEIMGDNYPSIYLCGSVVLGDFKLGWSDIDILVLTQKEIPEDQAERFVGLRQELLKSEPDNPYYRSFEGGMLSVRAFIDKTPDRVVYWGTSGQKITDSYQFDSFSMSILLENGRLLYGEDIRNRLTAPTFEDLKKDVARQLDTIRNYAHLSGQSLYSFGWMLDISRCLYTLRTGGVISKTAAGEWALREEVCPTSKTLEYALKVRRLPIKYKNDAKTLSYAGTINDDVQRYADVLEKEIRAQRI